MTEHRHWRGEHYKSGSIRDQKIAVVGYSHYWAPKDDDEDVTCEFIRKIMSGECKVTFSTNIRNYFGFSDHKDFWKRVIFFNYMPCGVGEASARYNVGSSEMRTRAKRRFISILGEVKPNKVLVFTHKGWMDCPDTPCEPLGNAFPPDFTWGKYAIGEHVTAAYGLRHPQGANGDTMKRAVRHILDMPVL